MAKRVSVLEKVWFSAEKNNRVWFVMLTAVEENIWDEYLCSDFRSAGDIPRRLHLRNIIPIL